MRVASPSEPTLRRALVTGLDGFTGHYVRPELEAAGFEVFGLRHSIDGKVREIDLLDVEHIRREVASIAPDVVLHLAAIAFVAHGDVETIYRTNVLGTRNLLDALTRLPKPPSAVVLASSANVYGNAAVERIQESQPPAPANDYAVSKLAMEYMARLWMDRLPITIARPFNYTGVGQSLQFVIPKIVDHFRRGEKFIELGNVEVARDFSDVRDVAHCYRRLVEIPPVGECVNLCSGQFHALSEVIAELERLAGYRIEIRVNPAFVRASEVIRLAGDPSRLEQLIQTKPGIPLRDTLAWMYHAR
jgi:nucleoside-diphosphate-sugar epimerase